MGECILDWSKTAATNASADGAIVWSEGQAPSSVNDSFRSMMAAHAKELSDTNGTMVAAGTANAYLVAANTAYASLVSGIRLIVKAPFTNTGACTLTLYPLGAAAFAAKAIRIFSTSGEGDPGAGQIRAGHHYIFEYDSAANAAAGAWICLNPVPGGGTLWASWTPTVASTSGTITSASAVGTYQQIGKAVYINALLSITNNGTGSGLVQSSVPVSPRSAPSQTHFVAANVTTQRMLFCYLNNDGNLYISHYANLSGDTYPLRIHGEPGFEHRDSWGDLAISGIYEAA